MPSPHRPTLLAAAVLLGAALQVADGFYAPAALAGLVTALACAWAALLLPHALARVVPDRDDLLRALAVAAVLGQLAVILRAPIGMYFALPLPGQHPGFVPGLAIAAGAALAAFTEARWLRRLAIACVLGVSLLLGGLTYRGSPDPAIDVVTVHREAYATLARGKSPFSMTFPDLYAGQQSFYPPGMVKDGHVQYGFPYPPLSLLMAWPGHLAGDFRWAELAAWVMAGAAVIAAGRSTGLAVLAVAVWLFTPRAFFALEQAWTEPLALVWLGAAVLAASRDRRVWAAVFVGLAAATKQYLVLAVPLLPLLDPPGESRRWRGVTIAVGAAAAATLPGLVADPQGFLGSVVMVQVREVLRMDSLSLAVTYAHATGGPLPGAVYVTLVLGALALAAWAAPRNGAGFTAALAVTLLTTFAFGKKAFCNYYIAVIAVLAMAIVMARPAPRDDAPPGPLTPA